MDIGTYGVYVVLGGFAFVFILMILGMPLAFAFGLGVFLTAPILGIRVEELLSTGFRKMDSFTLIAVPAFTLAGLLMNKAGLADRFLGFTNTIIGKIRGGTGVTTIGAETFFGACSGSCTAATAVFTTIMTPKMMEEGYSKKYATALIASSSNLATLIPPSIAMILFGFLTGTAISTCFLASAVPGLMLATGYIIIHLFLSRNMSIKPAVKLPPRQTAIAVWKEGRRALFALLAPLFILGSIYGGFATPTEAGAIAAVYTGIIGYFIYRTLRLRDILECVIETATICGVIGLLLTFVLMWSRLFTLFGITDAFAKFALMMPNKYLVLLAINIVVLFMGMIMDELSTKVLAIPVFFPVILSIGVHPVHFAAFLVLNSSLGTCTPPVGTNVYMAASIARIPASDIFPYAVRFFLLGGLPVLALTTYFPVIALWLPGVFGLV